MGLDHTWKRDIMRQEWSLLCERLSTQIDKTNKIFKEFLFDDAFIVGISWQYLSLLATFSSFHLYYHDTQL